MTGDWTPELPEPFPSWATVDDDGFPFCVECGSTCGWKRNPAATGRYDGHDPDCFVAELLGRVAELEAALRPFVELYSSTRLALDPASDFAEWCAAAAAALSGDNVRSAKAAS